MKQLLVRGSAAALVAAAALSAACSNDPTSPKAPSAARMPAIATVHNYVGSTASGPVSGGISIGNTGGASTQSGYTVGWARDGQTPQQTTIIQHGSSSKP